jgi:RND superfamily putative drug exporter
MLRWFANLALHRHRTILACSAVVLVLALLMVLYGGQLASGTTEGIEASVVQELVTRDLAYPGDSSFLILFHNPDFDWRDPRYPEALGEALTPLRADPRIRSVVAPDDAPPLLAQRLVSADRHYTLAIVTLRETDFGKAEASYPELRDSVRSDTLTFGFTGFLAYRNDLDRTLEYDVIKAELISLPLAMLVLLIVFRSVFAAAISVGVGALAVLTAIAVLMALSHFINIATYAINMASLIGLGVAIDYSLFIVSRYRDELAGGASLAEALTTAIETTGHAVLFSGFAVAVGLSGLFFFRGSFLATMGIGGSVVVALSVLFAFTFLPAVLVALGPRIDAWTIRLPRLVPADGIWKTIAYWVMRRPVLILVVALAIVVTLGSPFLRMNFAAADIATLPRGVAARDVYEQLKRVFPDQTRTRILILVEYPTAPALTPERVGEMYDFGMKIAALPGVVKVEGVVDNDPRLARGYFEADAETATDELPKPAQRMRSMVTNDRIALVMALTDASPVSEEARALVREIRRTRKIGDGTIRVGGPPANDVDLNAFILSRAPWAITFILAVTYVVLFVMLRSAILPLKAVIMNLLSIAASFGALVWIFEDGNLGWLLTFEPHPIDIAVPVLLFCSVFGLSMDYEVLMLSRMREEYLRSGDNTWAVAEGLERTGRLVTSAAAIMVTVFSAFGLGRVIMVQALGVALAVAVALDATLVRVLIVPATMRLFGDFNWWAPRWLGGTERPERATMSQPAAVTGSKFEVPSSKD